MRVTYDPRTDAAYIYLVEISAAGVARTLPTDKSINLDFDHDGKLVGIEVLDAQKNLPESVLIGADSE